MPHVFVEKDKCKGCELCVKTCPEQVLAMSDKLNVKGYFYAEPVRGDRCIGCTLCAVTCPDVAIEVVVQGAQYRFFGG